MYTVEDSGAISLSFGGKRKRLTGRRAATFFSLAYGMKPETVKEMIAAYF